jgi:hypothetical protein
VRLLALNSTCTRALTFEILFQEDFELLAVYIEMLDQLVLSTRMFKYQHVSCGDTLYYIVACPRVACPFDKDEQEAPYPSAYCHELLELGWDLKQATARFDQRHLKDLRSEDGEGGVRLEMKVGINAGPVACVVLGTCRRFYCVYGNTVNTAARMCSYASPGAVCLSPDFAKLVSQEASGGGEGGGGDCSASNTLKGENGHDDADENGHAVALDDVTVPAMTQAGLSNAEFAQLGNAEFARVDLSLPKFTSSSGAGSCSRNSALPTNNTLPTHETETKTVSASLRHGGIWRGDGVQGGNVAVNRDGVIRMSPLAATLERPWRWERRGSSFCLESRGMHTIKGKGLMQLIDAIPVPQSWGKLEAGGEGGNGVFVGMDLGHGDQGVGGADGTAREGMLNACAHATAQDVEGADLGNQINDDEHQDLTTQGGRRSISTQRMTEWMTRFIHIYNTWYIHYNICAYDRCMCVCVCVCVCVYSKERA